MNPALTTLQQNQIGEWSFASETSFDVTFTGPENQQWQVPAFWAGGSEWRGRFAGPVAGRYSFRCPMGQGEFEVVPYDGTNPLYRHGGVHVSADRRHLEHADGTPFFWLGDTWWMSLCARQSFAEFQDLARDRAAKGFSVIQIVAGQYPDQSAFDPRGANEAGFPWTADYTTNPAYFDAADRRIACLIENGLVPCIVGSWGYALSWMGVETMKTHWRNLIARWGAHPVVWCLAGEATMPWYGIRDPAEREVAKHRQREGWTEVARFVRTTDPFHRLLTVHPPWKGRDEVTDDRLLDLDMLQTGHGGEGGIPGLIKAVRAEVARTPTMPVLVGEPCYEGLFLRSDDEVVRMQFWTAMLSGCRGHTYGANGLWQLNRPGQPFGPSPHGGDYGGPPWQEARRLPGAAQVALGAAFLRRFGWWRFEPHPEWGEPAGTADNVNGLFVAGIPRHVRIGYSYSVLQPGGRPSKRILGLETDVVYQARYFDPRIGTEYPLGEVRGDADGAWTLPMTPLLKDYVVALEANR
jgi:hypothetical protein